MTSIYTFWAMRHEGTRVELLIAFPSRSTVTTTMYESERIHEVVAVGGTQVNGL